PRLLSVHDVVTAVFHRPRRYTGEVAPGAGLGEKLTPDVFPGEHRRDVALLLLLGPVHDEDRTAVAGADRIDRPLDPRLAKLVVDDELHHRIGIESPRPWPMGDDVAAVGEILAGGVRVLGQPVADGRATGVVLAGLLEAHGRDHTSHISKLATRTCTDLP